MGDVRTPLVEFDDLAVSYGLVQALAGVTGAFLPGPTGLLGPNGAGKTTLLKTLLGFLQPDRGRMTAFGKDPTREPLEVRRRLGYMPEQDCHVPGMTAAAFVAFAGELSGLPRDEAISRSHEVLYYVGLGEARYRNVETYSTGMKQRVKLAQALVHDPELLLLDEPTNGLDPQGREEMLALIRDIATRRGMSLILCSHLLHDVERVCDQVIVLNQGQIARQGEMRELTGARKQVFDVRFKGDAAAVLTDLKDMGADWREGDDGVRLFLPEGQGPDTVFRVAQAVRGAGAPPPARGRDARGRVPARPRPRDPGLMPIYDQGYRRYEARAPLRKARFWPITREALRLVLSKRAFLGLLAAAFIPFVVRAVQIYVVTRFPEAGRILPVDGRLFGDFLNQQIGFTILLSIFGASGLVANDLRTGAILAYLSRPLTRRDYVLGKLLVPLFLNLAVTLAPAVLLYVAGLSLAPELYLKWELAWIGPAIVVHALSISLVVSLLTLAISSLSRSARVAGLGLFGMIAGLEMVRLVLQQGFRQKYAMLLSVQTDLKALGVALFGLTDREVAVAWGWAALVLVLLSLACLAILRSRVRAVEIVT